MQLDSFVTEARDGFRRFATKHTDPEIDDSGV
jgi:hypothetical protein